MKTTALIILAFTAVFINQTKAQKITIDQIFSKQYRTSFISSGDNFPDFDLKKDSINLLLITLHKDIAISEFKSKTRFSDAKMDSVIRFLEGKNFIHKIGNQYKPTIFIAEAEDGATLYNYALPISGEIVKSVNEMLPFIKEKFSQTNLAKTQNFEHWSFFILSNVLLDNWQINSVEQEFLKADSRPQRNGKNYYCSILEKNTKNEPFGIYGNQMGKICVYGNNRIGFMAASAENKISDDDNKIFDEIASDFLPQLMKVLQNRREYAEKVYHETGYSKEITFNEFFIWWYHCIYTQSTDLMAAEGMLKVPDSGNFYYAFEN